MSDQNIVLAVNNLTVKHGAYLAVDDVSFQLRAGTNTAVIGPNGAGKSTLIQSILGLIKPTSGSVEILGKNPQNMGKLWQRIGYIPQKFLFDRHFPLTVTELVSLAFSQSSWGQWSRKKLAIKTALEQVHLEQHASQKIGNLSGGQLKRLLLAYCLVIPRDLLILDEAMSGVDATGEAEFAELLATLQKQQGWTILQISHDLDMVNRHCDRVLCFNQKLLCQGVPNLTLSSGNLALTYGSTFTRYWHRHEHSRLN